MRVIIEHVQAVEERATFYADVPEGEDPVAYVQDNIQDLMSLAATEGRLETEILEALAEHPTRTHIEDEDGEPLGYDDGEDEDEDSHS